MSKNDKKEVLGIITARGGSKSILKKSIAVCAGKPLIYYTIEAAKRAKNITRLIISTDDREIADIAESYGVEVPFIRPSEYAQDDTPDLPVMHHALMTLKETEGYMPDALVHLRPTTPLKSARDIDRGIELLLQNSEAHSVRSVCEPLHTPFKMYRIDEGESFLKPILTKEFPDTFEQYKEPFNMPRQKLPKVWRHSGYVDVIRPHVILELESMSGSKILPLYFDAWRDIDIDSIDELDMATAVIEKARKEGRDIHT